MSLMIDVENLLPYSDAMQTARQAWHDAAGALPPPEQTQAFDVAYASVEQTKRVFEDMAMALAMCVQLLITEAKAERRPE